MSEEVRDVAAECVSDRITLSMLRFRSRCSVEPVPAGSKSRVPPG